MLAIRHPGHSRDLVCVPCRPLELPQQLAPRHIPKPHLQHTIPSVIMVASENTLYLIDLVWEGRSAASGGCKGVKRWADLTCCVLQQISSASEHAVVQGKGQGP